MSFRLFSHEKVLSLWRNSKLMDAMLIGREKEKHVLQNALNGRTRIFPWQVHTDLA